jgi:hypothetical protein
MSRFNVLFILVFSFLLRDDLFGITVLNCRSLTLNKNDQDTLIESQILYNGRRWRNLYYKVREDQFLFSNEFLPGSVTIEGNFFPNVSIRYDIYDDEIMTVTNHGSILQLNKEMVDSFNIIYQNKQYHFKNIREDSLKGFNGYMNILYKGKNALYVKYKKEIELLAVDKKYDEFYQIHRIYFEKDGIVYPVTGKREFLNLMDECKLQIRSFIKKYSIKISKKQPESFLPVIGFYDSLSP